MRDRLPVHIEDRELPMDQFEKKDEYKEYSYGYVNILYLVSLIVTVASILTIVILRK